MIPSEICIVISLLHRQLFGITAKFQSKLLVQYTIITSSFRKDFIVISCHQNALEHSKSESIVMVDELVQRIDDRFPGAHGFERCSILKEVSKIYGKKVEYMGKKKRYVNVYNT